MPLDPAQIADTRRSIIERMAISFALQEGALALFLRGSLAEGTADAWSDIDAAVVLAPEWYDEITARRHSAPAEWGDLLYNSGGLSPSLCISHFRPFVKLDLFYYLPEDLVPSPWFARPINILFDRRGLVKAVIEASAGMRSQPAPAQINASIDQALSCAHEVVRRVERGELAYAHFILAHLRSFVVEADDLLTGSLAIGFSHLESRCRTPEVLDTVARSFPAYDAKSILESLTTLCRLYRKQVTRLNETFALERDGGVDAECFQLAEDWLETFRGA